ncbi:MAG: low molecular weight protein-tyrosine-phosphatase [Gammaproteobacteria bacterium]|nr:low molecular weight protein-tyrosine-phosphatase [Gammaproteobacteria bacterium]
MNNAGKIKVLFVCMGNICRSPTAEGVFRNHVREQGLQDQIEIDSAGTHSYHIGKPPDSRAQLAANRRDIDLSDLRARQFRAEDFEHFDYVLAMDQANYFDMQALYDGEVPGNFSLFLEYAEHYPEQEVPDPYYGGDMGFEHVLNLVEDASRGLLQHIRQQHDL